MEAASGITHLLASTFVRGHTFQLIRTPSIPSGSVFAISDMFENVRERERERERICLFSRGDPLSLMRRNKIIQAKGSPLPTALPLES